MINTKQVTVEKYVECVISIYEENPAYQEGGDGSNGKCDCIGMSRGALHRAGIEDTPHMRGCNDAARKTVQNLAKIKKASQLQVGDVVLKVRDKDDEKYPLPDQYREGKGEYDSRIGEINFTHWGTVISVNPLRIMHMTSPSAMIDEKLGKWSWFGTLPWVTREQKEEPEVQTAIVRASSGKTVKMRAKPSALCRLYWDVPIGSEVVLMSRGETWSEILWNNRTGYMKSEFLQVPGALFTVTVLGASLEDAEALCEKYPGSTYEEMI